MLQRIDTFDAYVGIAIQIVFGVEQVGLKDFFVIWGSRRDGRTQSGWSGKPGKQTL